MNPSIAALPAAAAVQHPLVLHAGREPGRVGMWVQVDRRQLALDRDVCCRGKCVGVALFTAADLHA